jgi:hypothetical protein
MSGRAVAEWQLGNFGVSSTVGIPLGMRLDVWNDSSTVPNLSLYARNGQSIVVSINQNASVSLIGRLFSSVTLSSPPLQSQVLWALVDESSPPTWGPVSGEAVFPVAHIVDANGVALPAPWNGSNLAPATGRFVGQVVATAAGAIDMTVNGPSTPGTAFTVATASAGGQAFPFAVFVQLGGNVGVTNATIQASGITL